MRAALRDVADHFIEITGFKKERQAKIKEAKELLQREGGEAVCYSESTIRPAALQGLKKYPWLMDLDVNFFRWLSGNGIPVGIFYRDIYWNSPEGMPVKKPFNIKLKLVPFFGARELRQYSKFLDVLFLPSKALGKYLPCRFDCPIVPLPPGGNIPEGVMNQLGQGSQDSLKLLYVGSVAPPHYDISKLVFLVEETPGVEFVVVSRQEAIDQNRERYKLDTLKSTRVCSASGKELEKFYAGCDAVAIVRAPSEYLAACMPVKVFESLAFGVPLIVSSESTTVADFVRKEDIGWVVESMDDVAEILNRLKRDHGELAAKRSNAITVREGHTWKARAEEVVRKLRESKKV